MTQRPKTGPGDLLTPGEAAALVGVTPRTIHRYGTAGLIGFTRLPSGHRRYFREDVTALLPDAA